MDPNGNDTVLLGHLTAVNYLDSAAKYDRCSTILASLYHRLDTTVMTEGTITEFYCFYEYCEVGHPIVKEEVKYLAYPNLRAWKRGNRRKTNDQAADLFIIGKYHIDHRNFMKIIWEPWFDSTMSETEDVLNVKLLSRKRIPLEVPNRNCEYYIGNRYWRQVTGEVRIPLNPPLSMSPHISSATLAEQTSEVDHMLADSQRMGNLDLFGPTTLRAGITPVVVTSASVHSLSQDFCLPESVRDAQRLQVVEDELAIACRQIDSIDHWLYAHLRRGRDVRVVPLPPGGDTRTRQHGSGPRTREGGTNHRGDDIFVDDVLDVLNVH
ncbi:hypothetical protein GIB67_035617 [Kingdonia uniflora]|uniref:Uncharacterized protein n=1 Tax=Kingdonia uniflora TaxID=39325 RepID=A0A7J7LKS1_9MAGN|nr:hypothetical protein GIB67_035617 [Kingdonia uniflora]